MHGSKILEILGFFQTVFGFCRDFFGPPRGRERAQNVPRGTSFRTPAYRPKPANGGPIGGKSPFWRDPLLPPVTLISTKPGTQTKVFGVLCPGRRPGNKNTKNLGTKFFLVPKTENRHERGLQGTDLRLDP